MTSGLSKEQKKEVIKDIIIRLHKGLTVQEATKELQEKVGSIGSTEIAEIEQSLIREGLSTDEIKKFCNVHALLFQSALQQSVVAVESPAHPISLFKSENREIEKIAGKIKETAREMETSESLQIKERMKDLLTKLKGIEVHYTRKEQVLFPYLEKHGFFGPSKVMWGKDNDIRDMLRRSIAQIDALKGKKETEDFLKDLINPLVEEVEGMIFKEENILFPTTMEKLTVDEWVEVLKASDDVGYVFIEKPKETELLIFELKTALVEEPTIKDGKIISFPSGELSLKELMNMLNTLPVDLTFVDKDDRVKYFSESRDRIFVRPRSIIGRQVQNCHPPQSLDVVEKILTAFKEGKKDFFDFWINFMGKFVYIRYFAVRDRDRNYLGTLEVTQNIKAIKELEGEKRLLDESY
ncbi:MAG: DUF438 domain-containing protein [Acidobacteriota bacterium]